MIKYCKSFTIIEIIYFDFFDKYLTIRFIDLKEKIDKSFQK